MTKYLFLINLVLFTSSSFSQSEVTHQEDNLIITITPNWGFALGSNYSLVNNYTTIDTTFNIFPTSVINTPGLRLGVFGDIKIQERFTLIPRAELSLNYTTVQFNNQILRLDPVNLDFMLHAKLNFKKRDSKVNPYCYLGPGLRVPLQTNSTTNYNTKSALSGDIAFGLDIDVNWFYISPEIRISGGITNIKAEESWEKLRGSYAAFTLNFTGK